MGKSKRERLAEIDDGGFVPRQSSLMIEINKKTRVAKEREARLAKGRRDWERRRAALLEEERKRYEAANKITEEERRRKAEEMKRKQEEYDRPLPDFPPRVPQEVRGKFFRYVARVVSDTLWNLENPNYRDDPFGYDQENAAVLGEEILPKKEKPPRKKVPAECLKAALRITQLKNGWQERLKRVWIGNPERRADLEALERQTGLHVDIYIFIDTKNPCFDERDLVWLDPFGLRWSFDDRIVYRIRRNLWKEKNVPYFASFDPEQQSLDTPMRVVEFEVCRERACEDLDHLKKSGYLLSNEERVVHLEIF